MKILKEFREFAVRGNAIDLAVAFIIGGAFGKIVTSLVNDVVMPPIGVLLSDVDFSQLAVTLKAAKVDAATGKTIQPAVVLAYGAFINTLLQFLIIAVCVFAMVKAINRLRRAAGISEPPQKQV